MYEGEWVRRLFYSTLVEVEVVMDLLDAVAVVDEEDRKTYLKEKL